MYSSLGIVAVAVVSWFAYQGYLETRVNSPLAAPKVALPSEYDDRYWGSYRPGVYFGLKTRDPESLLAGLMWFLPNLATPGKLNLRYINIILKYSNLISLHNSNYRHECNQGDDLEQYGWREHDGRNFGLQVIVDKFIQLETSYVTRPGGNHGGDWTARILVQPRVK